MKKSVFAWLHVSPRTAFKTSAAFTAKTLTLSQLWSSVEQSALAFESGRRHRFVSVFSLIQHQRLPHSIFEEAFYYNYYARNDDRCSKCRALCSARISFSRSELFLWRRLKHNYAETPKRRFTCKMRCRGYCYFECIKIYIFFPYTTNEYDWIRLQIITMADLSSCKTKNPARQNGISTLIVKQLMQAT